jgi:hypothetical protein
MMFDYQLQVVFEPFQKNSWSRRYRFAVIDPNNFKGYPANFVCLLPKKIFESGKPVSDFGKKIWNKSLEFAVALLEQALKQEKDEKVKTELEKRRRHLELERPKLICGCCHEEFEEYGKTKYKRKLCKNCLESRFLQNQN